jgi:hypothetical protein
LATYPKRTQARHQIEIRRHLGIQRWGGAAESLAVQTIERIVGGRAHFSDLIDGAIEALITAHYNAGAQHTAQTGQWHPISGYPASRSYSVPP